MDTLSILACIGFTLVITRSSIMEYVKRILAAKLVEVLDCPMCVGVWVGFLHGFLHGLGVHKSIECGFVISMLAYFFVLVTDLIADRIGRQ